MVEARLHQVDEVLQMYADPCPMRYIDIIKNRFCDLQLLARLKIIFGSRSRKARIISRILNMSRPSFAFGGIERHSSLLPTANIL